MVAEGLGTRTLYRDKSFITPAFLRSVEIGDAFSIRSQKEVLRVTMSNILKLFCEGKSWASYKPFYPAKLTVLVYRNQQRRDS
ncbi:hypothetical protein DPMN_161356 [Dreissena polymorpha]|uniref:Uncharacterized protein n=1 Tax=Dreissena polymorpha TaxID=45954 RepID=A0A9D4EPU3_DREPO|nr:hypothetical protein DPMN_161356 [Dreissena polymorpha]